MTTLGSTQPLSNQQIDDIQTLARAKIDVFSAKKLLHFNHEIIPPRVTQNTFFYLPLDGELLVTVQGKNRSLTPNNLLLTPAGRDHCAINIGGRFEVISLHTHISFGHGIANQALFSESIFSVEHAPYWHQMLMRSTTFPDGVFTYKLIAELIRQLLIQLVAQGSPLLSQKCSIDSRIIHAIEAIKLNLKNPLALEKIGKEVGLAATQFRSLFKKQVGSSPKEYQNQLRLEMAFRYLQQRELSIKQVAAELGYCTPSHLINHFKNSYGMTPGQLRESKIE